MYLLKPVQGENVPDNALDLHSTMYLLKLNSTLRNIAHQRYLHSTMYLLKRIFFKDINSPLVKFTFHYVSIKTV